MSDAAPGHCTLVSGYVPLASDMHLGRSVAVEFPDDVEYRMSDLFPDDLLLSDNFKCAGQLLVSAPLRTWLEDRLAGHHLEFLRVTILNHKRRVASKDYFIFHSMDMVDCIDIAKSKVKWNPLDKSTIMFCKKLVINGATIPDGLQVFRPVHWGSYLMVDPELARGVESAGFSGLRFIQANGFDGIG